eukprot:GGOE01036920.1.p1 GENE.GGOE01036920.1~~GGOE01036920.1.p1  ORF type:complete len:695 (-),score=178.53 GGOE01036920.1:241-2325(-)
MGRKDASRRPIPTTSAPAEARTKAERKVKGASNPLGILRWALIIALGFAVFSSGLHVMTVLHDGQTWWSGISVPEKETYFVSEQAFYYLWFKIVADRRIPFLNATQQLLDDQTVEFPNRVNPLQRFTIYPELLLGWAYRAMNATGLTQKHPIDFYVRSAFLLQALHPTSLYATALVTTGSIPCALASAAAYFANYDHLTRSWNQVPLRETFAVPLLAVQYAVLTAFLEVDERKHPRLWSLLLVSMLGLLVGSIVSWQLSSSLLMLQLAALLVMFALGPHYLSFSKFWWLAVLHTAGVFVASVALFGNLMTACSLYACMAVSCVVSSPLLATAERPAGRVRRLLRLVFVIGTVLAASIALRLTLQRVLDIHDDDHMPNLVKAKRGTFTDFHTSLYLRIDGYRGLPGQVYWELTKTGLLVFTTFIAVGIALHVLADLFSSAALSSLPSRSAVCHLGLALQYTVLCAMISRLRGLWTPSLCILVGLLPSDVLWEPLQKRAPQVRGWMWKLVVYLVMVLAIVLGTGQFAWLREKYSAELVTERPSMRDLFRWIRKNTPPNAVIGSEMIMSAMLRLSTGRRTIVHPHYEDMGARHKYYMVAHFYARRRLEDVHRILTGMGAEYFLDNCMVCDSEGYANMVDSGEDGNPPPQLPHTRQLACHAARQPNPYFMLLYQPKGKSFGFGDFRLYKVLNPPNKNP